MKQDPDAKPMNSHAVAQLAEATTDLERIRAEEKARLLTRLTVAEDLLRRAVQDQMVRAPGWMHDTREFLENNSMHQAGGSSATLEVEAERPGELGTKASTVRPDDPQTDRTSDGLMSPGVSATQPTASPLLDVHAELITRLAKTRTALEAHHAWHLDQGDEDVGDGIVLDQEPAEDEVSEEELRRWGDESHESTLGARMRRLITIVRKRIEERDCLYDEVTRLGAERNTARTRIVELEAAGDEYIALTDPHIIDLGEQVATLTNERDERDECVTKARKYREALEEIIDGHSASDWAGTVARAALQDEEGE